MMGEEKSSLICMAPTTVLSPPIPAYQNLPINAEFFQPSQFYISNIAIGPQTTVTTTVNNNYVIGQECRLVIPNGFGCIELNKLTGFVTSIPAPNQVVLTINSQGATPFTSNSFTTQPQIVAIGDVNTGYISTTGRSVPATNIPGSFINISPN